MNDEVALLNHKVDNLTETVVDVKATIKELTNVVTKLTLIEERQLHSNNALEKAFLKIDIIENRLSNLEKHVPANKKVSIWLDRATWAAMGLLCMLVFKKSGLL